MDVRKAAISLHRLFTLQCEIPEERLHRIVIALNDVGRKAEAILVAAMTMPERRGARYIEKVLTWLQDHEPDNDLLRIIGACDKVPHVAAEALLSEVRRIDKLLEGNGE